MKAILIFLLAAVMIPLGFASLRAQVPVFTDSELEQPVYRLLSELHGWGRENRMLNVPPQDGRLLKMLVRMNGIKNALEVGTSNGLSAIWIALGLRETGGKLTTLEIDPNKVKLAGENFAKAGVSELITIVEGDALAELPKLTGEFDLVFLDAAKGQYKGYLDAVWDRIPSGGIIVAHNAIQMADAMRDYLDFVQNHPELQTVMLNTSGDGVALSYRK
ncbi:MAG: O-methyltransferase [Candidatus Glassbacteria bacterium]|nr:O-methyltransferase [Candidatus Glassbacteria bacterium]